MADYITEEQACQVIAVFLERVVENTINLFLKNDEDSDRTYPCVLRSTILNKIIMLLPPFPDRPPDAYLRDEISRAIALIYGTIRGRKNILPNGDHEYKNFRLRSIELTLRELLSFPKCGRRINVDTLELHRVKLIETLETERAEKEDKELQLRDLRKNLENTLVVAVDQTKWIRKLEVDAKNEKKLQEAIQTTLAKRILEMEEELEKAQTWTWMKVLKQWNIPQPTFAGVWNFLCITYCSALNYMYGTTQSNEKEPGLGVWTWIPLDQLEKLRQK